MTLVRVGGQLGPDMNLLRALGERAPGRKIYGAGGVRGAADLHALAKIGVPGVLVASALHDGRLGAEDIRAFGNA